MRADERAHGDTQRGEQGGTDGGPGDLGDEGAGGEGGIMTKLAARDRTQLAVLAYETGLVRPGWLT